MRNTAPIRSIAAAAAACNSRASVSATCARNTANPMLAAMHASASHGSPLRNASSSAKRAMIKTGWPGDESAVMQDPYGSTPAAISRAYSSPTAIHAS